MAGIETGKIQFDIESAFAANYERIARVIAKVIRDPARAEELAVEVFLKLGRARREQTGNVEGWLYRTAVRISLDELRRRMRRGRYESLAGFFHAGKTPEEIHSAQQEHERVRRVLAALKPREAELLLLRSDDLSYEDLAAALELNPASVGKLLSRAQQAFRKEYTKLYGER